MTHQEIRKKFKDFFESKGHKWVPSSSLLPDDPSVLFTTAGMQQFKPYYTGQANPMKDFSSLNTASIQKSMRTSDIDEVGDESHLTFFEMMGNFSFGGYWKELAIAWAYEFITSEEWMNLKIDYVAVFGGEDDIPADEESELLWKEIAKNTGTEIKIIKEGRKSVFWGPTGDEGPCGPTTDIYVNG
ncbi:MAG: alanine--tRNA ligase-related protein, partial [Candidatus Taylorbacteria bacterium]|nr:alanine--tRNA ligase-related protein [Candidatus Taylorbacteria bacterium]